MGEDSGTEYGGDHPKTNSRVVMVTNIAPQATADQMKALFNYIGKIEDLRLYPTLRDASMSVSTRCVFIKFDSSKSVDVCLHMNNTVFIDRAMIVSVEDSGVVPDETTGLYLSQNAKGPNKPDNSGILPANIVNRLEGLAPNAVIQTHDPALESEVGLPQYPPLQATTPSEHVEEIRRTVIVSGLSPTTPLQQVSDVFSQQAGEIKYIRFCSRPSDPVKYCLIEFSKHSSIIPALKLNDIMIGESKCIKVNHSRCVINKPSNTKSNEDAQLEIEEAMKKVKEAQSLVSAAVDPLLGILGGALGSAVSAAVGGGFLPREAQPVTRGGAPDRYACDPRARTRSRSRSGSRYSDRRRRSRSRDRRRRRSRSRDRRRSRSRDRDHRRRRSRSRDRERRRRSRSRERKRSRSRDRKRSRSRGERKSKKRSRSRDRDRERGERKRSKSRDRKRSRSKERKKDKKEKNGDHKVSRDYDQEEAGFETEKKAEKKKLDLMAEGKDDDNGGDDMDISNSP